MKCNKRVIYPIINIINYIRKKVQRKMKKFNLKNKINELEEIISKLNLDKKMFESKLEKMKKITKKN